MDETKKHGRPIGSTQYDEPKVLSTHRMTEKAHKYIRAHKEKIEKDAKNWDA